MSKKEPNFVNQNETDKKYRQLKQYSKTEDTPKEFLAKASIEENLQGEFLKDKD
jgi:hypothetical protein